MELFVIVLNEEKYLDEVLSLFVELGITGATILDSVGMGHYLAQDMPIFAGFRDLIVGHRPYNKTIFTVLPTDIKAEEIIKGIEEIIGDLRDQGVGLAFTVPVSSVHGLAHKL